MSEKVIALGFFDGVHIGHGALLSKAKERAEELDAELSDTVAQWLAGALEQAQSLGCDFLDLRSSVLKTSKQLADHGGQWDALFPVVPISVTVDGQIDKSYDLSE